VLETYLTDSMEQAITRRRDKTAKAQDGGKGAAGEGKPNIKKAAFDTTKKKEIGVSDLTLISKVTPEAINDNLKKRFEAGEIYVRKPLDMLETCPEPQTAI
jgi:myosin-1